MNQEKGNWKPINSRAIISNINLVFKTGNIEKLNGTTYRFVHNLSGFIAHYDLRGFQCTYQDLRDFARDLLSTCTEKEALRLGRDRDFINWYGQAYCSSNEQAIRGIREVVLKYQESVQNKFQDVDADRLDNIIALAEEVKRRNDPTITKAFLNNF